MGIKERPSELDESELAGRDSEDRKFAKFENAICWLTEANSKWMAFDLFESFTRSEKRETFAPRVVFAEDQTLLTLNYTNKWRGRRRLWDERSSMSFLSG